jgi:Na+-driven multidrug efflux pump
MFWIYMGTAQCYFILRAGGDTKSTFLMDSGFMWFVNIPVVFRLCLSDKVSDLCSLYCWSKHGFYKAFVLLLASKKGEMGEKSYHSKRIEGFVTALLFK